MANESPTPTAQDDYGGEDSLFGLDTRVEPPSYSSLIECLALQRNEWEVTFDFWARGNFTRRLLHHRREGKHPVLVRVESLAEMKWAYRRLHLLGQPVEFVYCGADCGSGLALLQLPDDDRIEGFGAGGWGYSGTSSLTTLRDGTDGFVAMGWGKFLPASVARWLLSDVRDSFVRGDVFVAPAELIGLSRTAVDSRWSNLAKVTDGTPILPTTSAVETMLSLDIPDLDALSQQEFERLLAKNEDAVLKLRTGLRDLFQKTPGTPEDHLGALRLQVNRVGDLVQKSRIDQVHLAGQAAVGVLALGFGWKYQQPATTAAGASAAAWRLADLAKELGQGQRQLTGDPFYLLWKLGVRKPRHVASRRKPFRQGRIPANRPSPHHWMCPPTWGMTWPTAFMLPTSE